MGGGEPDRGAGRRRAAARLFASRGFVLAVVAGGCALRLAQYLSGRSLWLDESLLSLNIIHRPFSRLFDTLYYVQGAPPGFLLLERLAVDAFGSSEAALRLEPLLAGLASLPLFYFAARQLLGPTGASAALIIFAVLEGPILYSSEVKQYSDDLCFTLAVLLAGLSVTDRPLRNRETIGLAVLGAVAVWFSHAVVFVLAGVGVSLVAQAARVGDRQRLRRLLAVSASWGVSFALVYSVNVSHLPKGLGSFFLPIPPSSTHDVVVIAKSFEEFVRGELSLHLPVPLAVVGAALVLVGLVWVGRRSWVRLSMLTAPVVITAVASGVANYPWGGRFILFLMPLVPLLVVAGAKAIADRPWALAPTVSIVLVAAVTAPSFATAVWHLHRPLRIEEMAPIVRTLEARFQRGDTIYLNATAQYALRYYALDRHMGGRLPVVQSGSPVRALRSLPPRLIVGPDAVDVEAVPRRARVWVLLSHFTHFDPQRFLGGLDAEGRRLFVERHTGVVLALFDLRRRGAQTRTASS